MPERPLLPERPLSERLFPGSTYFSFVVVFMTTPDTQCSFIRFMGPLKSVYSLVVIIPFMVPFSLKILVRALVSIPQIPGMSWHFKKFWMVSSLRKLLGILDNSLTI